MWVPHAQAQSWGTCTGLAAATTWTETEIPPGYQNAQGWASTARKEQSAGGESDECGSFLTQSVSFTQSVLQTLYQICSSLSFLLDSDE